MEKFKYLETLSKEQSISYITQLQDKIEELELENKELKETKETSEVAIIRYKGLSEAAFESIFISENGKCVEQNKAAIDMFGYSDEEAYGRYGTEWIALEDRDTVLKNMIAGYSEPYRVTALRKDGSKFPCVLKGKTIYYKGKNLRVTSLNDISIRHDVEQKLYESEKRFESYFNNSPDGIFIADDKGNYLEVNPAACEITGYSKEELLKMSIKDITPEESLELTLNEFKDLQRKGSFNHTLKFIHKTNGIRWWSVKAIKLTSDRFLGYAKDITETIVSQEILINEESRFKMIFDTLSEGVALNEMIFDDNGKMIDYKILDVNQAFYNIANYNKEVKVIGNYATNIYALSPAFITEFWENHKNNTSATQIEYYDTISNKYYIISTSPFIINKFVTSFYEITHRKKTEKMLKESEAKFRNIIDLSPIPYALNDENLNITYLNPVFINTYGYDLEDIPTVNDWWPKAYPDPEYSEYLKKEWFARIDNSKATDAKFEPLEVNIRCKDGSYRTAIVETGSVSDDFSNLQIVIFYDITDRKLAEQEKLESEKRYRLLVETANEGILVAQGPNLKFVNAKILEFTGYSEHELLTHPFLSFVSDDYKDLIKENYVKRMNGDKIDNKYQIQIITKDNVLKWVDMSGVKIEWKGTPAIMNFVSDITDRKHSEELLKESEYRFRNLFEKAIDGIIYLSLKGEIIGYNESFASMHGYTLEEIKKISLQELEVEDISDILQERFARILQGEDVRFEVQHYHKNGSKITLDVSTSIVTSQKESYVVAFHRDITERKASEEEILKKNLELLETNASKDKFFSIIAHDLKSPFSGFLGLTKLMSDNMINLSLNEISEISKNLQDSANNLYKLLVNLLEWSRIQRGLTEFNPVKCNISFIVNQNIDLAYQNAQQKQIKITNNIPDDFEIYVDIPMINTVIRNLISNALKFTERGGNIDIGVSEINNDINNKCIYFKDNGIGIKEEILGKLFKVDQKVSRPGTEGEPSTGLGLLLCKEFINKHNGEIKVESIDDRGTTFYIILPNTIE